MPTYVYRCNDCEHEFETAQRMTDEPLKDCPKCKGEVARVLFPVGIVFKGSGFHVNDYSNNKCKVCPGAESCEKAEASK